MSKKKQRRFRAIETLEKGIAGYILINALLEQLDESTAHLPEAKFVAAASLNELMFHFAERNGPEALQALADKLTQTPPA